MLSFPLIILAAGASTRMGMPKGLIEVEGKPWIIKQLDDFAAVGGKDVVVVLGYDAEKYVECIERRGTACRAPTVVINPDPSRGQFSSLQAGCRALSNTFILPIDVPVPHKEVWEKLGAALVDHFDVCIPTWQGRGGHPVLLSNRFIKKLLTIPFDHVDARLDVQVHQLASDKVLRIPVDDKRVVMNMNTPEDRRYL